jgi:hypothetical protein
MNAATLAPSEISTPYPPRNSASPPLSRESASTTLIPSHRATAALLLNPALQAVSTIDHCQPFRDADTEFGEVFEELEPSPPPSPAAT